MINVAGSGMLGFVTGWIYFTALWESIRSRTAISAHSIRRWDANPILRFTLVVLSFSVVMLGGPGSLLASLCGFLIARNLLIRKIQGDSRHV